MAKMNSITIRTRIRGLKRATKSIEKMTKALKKCNVEFEKMRKETNDLKSCLPLEIEILEPSEFEVR